MAALIASTLGGPALAQAYGDVYRFQIPARPTGSALMALALQAEVSLGGDVSACRGTSRPVVGRLTLAAALARMLAGSGCTFQLADARTIVIRPAPAPVAPLPRPTPKAPPPPAPEIVVGELVVTAGRRLDLPARTPSSITALSGGEALATGTTDTPGLTAQVAGMTVTNLGPGRDKILLRGMSDGAFTGLTQSTVGLYVDNVPITYNAPDPDLKLVDVDRIEVMRGPQGTLYGAGSIGGIVRIVTRRPDLDDAQAEVSVTTSATQRGGGNNEIDATGNLPIFAGRLAIRASAYREQDSGYIDDVNLGKKDVNRVMRDGARVAVRAQATPDWSVLAGLIHQSINTTDTQYANTGLSRLSRANSVQEPHDNDFDEQYLTVEGQGSWGHVIASAANLSHHFDSRYDATAAPAAYFGAGGTAALDQAKDIDLVVTEIVLSSPDEGRLRWLVGGFGSVGETIEVTALNRLAPGPRPAYSERRTDKLSEFAVYGEASYDLTRTLSLTAGARWFRFDFETQSNVLQGAARRDFTGAGHAAGLSPKLSLRYRPTDRLTAYAQVSEGYRAGGFNTGGPIGQPFVSAPGGPVREFDPDELWNYELGVKLSSRNDRLRLRIAAFYADWRHIQSDQFLPSGLGYVANVGNGVNRGLEAEINWRLTEQLDLRAAALIDDPRLRSPDPSFASRDDANLPGVPRGLASVAMTYRRPLADGLAFRIDGQMVYVGPSRVTFEPPGADRMGDYVTGRLAAGLEARRWTFTAFIDNPADTRANTFSFGSPFKIGQEAITTPLRPRTIGARLGVHF